jgi:hypothetical protein
MLWIEGDLASAAARAGFIGYGQMLVRAGSFAHRLWLAAMAVGIEGVLVAGVVHGFARQHLNLGSGGYSSMLIFVAGRSDVEDAIHVSLEDTHNHEGVTNLG